MIEKLNAEILSLKSLNKSVKRKQGEEHSYSKRPRLEKVPAVTLELPSLSEVSSSDTPATEEENEEHQTPVPTLEHSYAAPGPPRQPRLRLKDVSTLLDLRQDLSPHHQHHQAHQPGEKDEQVRMETQIGSAVQDLKNEVAEKVVDLLQKFYGKGKLLETKKDLKDRIGNRLPDCRACNGCSMFIMRPHKCGRCRLVYYCSRGCLTEDWQSPA